MNTQSVVNDVQYYFNLTESKWDNGITKHLSSIETEKMMMTFYLQIIFSPKRFSQDTIKEVLCNDITFYSVKIPQNPSYIELANMVIKLCSSWAKLNLDYFAVEQNSQIYLSHLEERYIEVINLCERRESAKSIKLDYKLDPINSILMFPADFINQNDQIDFIGIHNLNKSNLRILFDELKSSKILNFIDFELIRVNLLFNEMNDSFYNYILTTIEKLIGSNISNKVLSTLQILTNDDRVHLIENIQKRTTFNEWISQSKTLSLKTALFKLYESKKIDSIILWVLICINIDTNLYSSARLLYNKVILEIVYLGWVLWLDNLHCKSNKFKPNCSILENFSGFLSYSTNNIIETIKPAINSKFITFLSSVESYDQIRKYFSIVNNFCNGDSKDFSIINELIKKENLFHSFQATVLFYKNNINSNDKSTYLNHELIEGKFFKIIHTNINSSNKPSNSSEMDFTMFKNNFSHDLETWSMNVSKVNDWIKSDYTTIVKFTLNNMISNDVFAVILFRFYDIFYSGNILTYFETMKPEILDLLSDSQYKLTIVEFMRRYYSDIPKSTSIPLFLMSCRMWIQSLENLLSFCSDDFSKELINFQIFKANLCLFEIYLENNSLDDAIAILSQIFLNYSNNSYKSKQKFNDDFVECFTAIIRSICKNGRLNWLTEHFQNFDAPLLNIIEREFFILALNSRANFIENQNYIDFPELYITFYITKRLYLNAINLFSSMYSVNDNNGYINRIGLVILLVLDSFPVEQRYMLINPLMKESRNDNVVAIRNEDLRLMITCKFDLIQTYSVYGIKKYIFKWIRDSDCLSILSLISVAINTSNFNSDELDNICIEFLNLNLSLIGHNQILLQYPFVTTVVNNLCFQLIDSLSMLNDFYIRNVVINNTIKNKNVHKYVVTTIINSFDECVSVRNNILDLCLSPTHILNGSELILRSIECNKIGISYDKIDSYMTVLMLIIEEMKLLNTPIKKYLKTFFRLKMLLFKYFNFNMTK